MDYTGLLAICIGIGLASACGFRVFVPLLALSIAAKSGFVPLTPGFEWVGSDIAVIAFAVATVVEIGAYYIPWVDNALDFVTTPLAMIAGVVVVAAVFTDVSPLLRWSSAIVAGAGTSGLVGVSTGLTRATSSMTTGGFANWLLATIENFGAIVTAILAIVVPLIGLLFLMVAVFLMWRAVRRFRNARRRRKSRLHEPLLETS